MDGFVPGYLIGAYTGIAGVFFVAECTAIEDRVDTPIRMKVAGFVQAVAISLGWPLLAIAYPLLWLIEFLRDE